jgi:hypothetical protein
MQIRLENCFYGTGRTFSLRFLFYFSFLLKEERKKEIKGKDYKRHALCKLMQQVFTQPHAINKFE